MTRKKPTRGERCEDATKELCRAIVDGITIDYNNGTLEITIGPDVSNRIRNALDDAHADGENDERERCKQVCKDHHAGLMNEGPRGEACWAIEDVLANIASGAKKPAKGGGR